MSRAPAAPEVTRLLCKAESRNIKPTRKEGSFTSTQLGVLRSSGEFYRQEAYAQKSCQFVLGRMTNNVRFTPELVFRALNLLIVQFGILCCRACRNRKDDPAAAQPSALEQS